LLSLRYIPAIKQILLRTQAARVLKFSLKDIGQKTFWYILLVSKFLKFLPINIFEETTASLSSKTRVKVEINIKIRTLSRYFVELVNFNN
jgi:hypothetical protein